MWNLAMCLCLGQEFLVSPQTLQQKLLDYSKSQFTKITNFNVNVVLKKNAHFGGRWVLSLYSSLGIAGSCYLCRKKNCDPPPIITETPSDLLADF